MKSESSKRKPLQQCICGTIHSVISSHSRNFNKHTCPNCHSVAFSPKKRGYDSVELSYSATAKYNDETALTSKNLRWSHEQITSIIHDQTCGILEYGCHNGFFVAHLRQLGLNSFGCDLNQYAIHSGKKTFNLSDRLFTIDELPYDLNIETLLFIDVIEHLREPRNFLEQALSREKKINTVIISGPTITRKFHDKSDFPPHHWWWLSEDGLDKLMQSLGFTPFIKAYQRDPILLFRNFIGRIIYGFFRKEFIDCVSFDSAGSKFITLGNILRFCPFSSLWSPKYCSVLVEYKRISQ